MPPTPRDVLKRRSPHLFNRRPRADRPIASSPSPLSPKDAFLSRRSGELDVHMKLKDGAQPFSEEDFAAAREAVGLDLAITAASGMTLLEWAAELEQAKERYDHAASTRTSGSAETVEPLKLFSGTAVFSGEAMSRGRGKVKNPHEHTYIINFYPEKTMQAAVDKLGAKVKETNAGMQAQIKDLNDQKKALNSQVERVEAISACLEEKEKYLLAFGREMMEAVDTFNRFKADIGVEQNTLDLFKLLEEKKKECEQLEREKAEGREREAHLIARITQLTSVCVEHGASNEFGGLELVG